ncbi:hypothetical protein IU433_20640 [Nocardia puris]|uniref:hypothetical protein n=1 Tax=Nocardia puris TaxID=208602 RepID=UPI0011BDE8AF|nr:hypothetical protein [Nocardia puris]MBF6212848.1 hypothetical protein [Nocardia puris]MBF6367782.1 hypothetical protein [Nocardia puris]MBF6461434.1 hypothetical protein [Nocardia puris]
MTAELPHFHGDFEAHVTVRVDDPADALERHAAAHGAKFVHIALAGGRVPVQPMFTLRRSGSLVAVRDSVRDFAEGVVAAGFGVTRVKIEATPWAAGVPRTDAAGFALGERFYFEHHIKLLLGRELSLFDYSTVELVIGLREVLGHKEFTPNMVTELVHSECGAGRTDRIDPREIAA